MTEPPIVERLLVPLPCGHLVDNFTSNVHRVTCEHCGTTWQLERRHGSILAQEMQP